MIIFIEKRAKKYPLTQKIIEQLPKAKTIYIDHYKNIFDINSSQKHIILAELLSPAVTQAPAGYGHSTNAAFFKTSLGCVYDCSYCFLKGAFKSDHMVYFVNYDEIWRQVESYAKTHYSDSPLWMYSSDYSDILGMNALSNFCEYFIEKFESLNSAMMEIRTKSGNITPLTKLGFVPKKTEIAFSLNPQCLIDNYERNTSSLQDRLKAMNTLIDQGFQVGIRLLPLLPVKNYRTIYSEFAKELKDTLPLEKISSSFAAGLLYTKRDYKVMLKKYPGLRIIHMLEEYDDGFYREARSVREFFYTLFDDHPKKPIFCLEE